MSERERIQITVPAHVEVSDKAVGAIENMLERAIVKAEPGGGLTWEIEMDGYTYSMTVDRDGNVRATASD